MRVLIVILALGAAACAAVAQTAQSNAPSFRDARAVCSAVAQGRAEFLDVASGSGLEDPEHWSSLDVDNDGTPEDIAIVVQGSSYTPAIQLREPDYAYLDSAYDEAGETLGPWGGQLFLLRHNGRIYEVYYSDTATLDYPVYVAIHLPAGEARWLCSFESNAPAPRLRPVRAGAAPICADIARRTVADYTPMNLSDREIEFSYYERTADPVDFMNDGTPRPVRRVLWASESSAGCDSEFYALPGEVAPPRYRQQTTPEDAALAALQTTTPDNLHVRIGNGYGACHGNIGRFHQINGTTVFEQRFPGERPQRHDHEFWWVSRVENGAVVRLCEATEFQHRRAVTYNSALYPQAR